MKTDTPRPIRLKDYRPPSHLIDSVALEVSLHPNRTRVRSRLAVRPNPAAGDDPGPLRLDGEHLELESVRLNGKPLEMRDYELTERMLTIPRLPAKSPFELEIVTYVDPEANKALTGLYRSRGIYCTQCEAEGFRRITYFLDRPDVLSVYKVRVEADVEEAATLLANGNPVEHGRLDRGRRYFAVWHDPHPKPCYLFALVGGNLGSITSTFRTMSGRKVDLGIHVEPGKEDRAHWAMDSLKRSMRWDERRFGREYDLDVFNIVAVSDFNMGAMENKGLNIFNDRLILASAETATDTNYEAIESVVAHEYFHNWTGNRITCRDWFQLCLKEGLTVYRDQEFSADERSRTVQRISDVRQLKAAQFPEDAGPLAHPVRPDSYIEINNFYTATVYEKGAELVRMIETILGKDGFRAGMDRYFERHDGEAATVEDFVSSFEQATGADLKHFRQWYSQAGTPQLVCSLDYDRAGKSAVLTVEQINPPTPREPKKKPLHIPLRMGLLGANGHDIPLQLESGEEVEDGVLHIKGQKQSFRFVNVPSQPVPSLLRGFSAPVRLTIDLSDRDLEFLVANDSDLYNRWQAATDYAMRTLFHLVRARTAGKRSSKGMGYVRALGAILAEDALEPAYLAELLRLPSESDIAREIASDVDPGAIHAARRQLIRLVGTALGDSLERIYKRYSDSAPYSPDPASAGRRSLRNQVLNLLAARDSASDRKRLVAHHRNATNMTDEAFSLFLIAASRIPEREAILQRFHDRWQSDHLVIDTWFAAQATAPQAATLSRVRALTGHPLFSLTTPNKVRALIGNFAMANPSQFNRPDGEGYEFLAGQVLALDRFNPQVAARLLSAFRSWRSLEPVRRRRAKRVLQKLAGTDGLSRDVFEIASRMIE
ncbi:MAG: aminopeptidase N [Hyphomicrobiaceae bacterium]